MKKIFVITALTFVHQYSFAQTKIGFMAGTTFSNYYSHVDGESEKVDPGFGFTTGVVASIPLFKKVSFQPMLNFTQKSAKESYGFDQKETFTITTNHLEIPLNVLYNAKTGSSIIFFGGGPNLSFGLNGKMKFKSTSNPSENTSQKIKFGNNEDEDDFKPIDAGLNITTGVRLKKGILIAFNYYHGFSNLFVDGNKDNKLLSRYWGLRIGYLIGK